MKKPLTEATALKKMKALLKPLLPPHTVHVHFFNSCTVTVKYGMREATFDVPFRILDTKDAASVVISRLIVAMYDKGYSSGVDTTRRKVKDAFARLIDDKISEMS